MLLSRISFRPLATPVFVEISGRLRFCKEKGSKSKAKRRELACAIYLRILGIGTQHPIPTDPYIGMVKLV